MFRVMGLPSDWCTSNFSVHMNSTGILSNTDCLVVGLRWDLRFCISNSSQVMHCCRSLIRRSSKAQGRYIVCVAKAESPPPHPGPTSCRNGRGRVGETPWAARIRHVSLLLICLGEIFVTWPCRTARTSGEWQLAGQLQFYCF